MMDAIFGAKEHLLGFRCVGRCGRKKLLSAFCCCVFALFVVARNSFLSIIFVAYPLRFEGIHERVFERHPFFRDLRQLEQRHHLEPSAVRQYVPIPAHEVVQPARFSRVTDQFRPRLQRQMVGVRQNNLIVQRFAPHDVHRSQSLQRALGAHRHEDRRGNGAVWQVEGRVARSPGSGVDVERQGRVGEAERRGGVFRSDWKSRGR